MSAAPLIDAHVHVLCVALVDALAILQIVQDVHHFVVHLVDFAGHIVAEAGLVDQKRNVVPRPNDQRHFDGRRCRAPISGHAVRRIAQDFVAGLIRFQCSINEQAM